MARLTGARKYRLRQELITPHTHHQDSLFERFLRSLTKERVWLDQFRYLLHLQRRVTAWIEHSNRCQ